MTSESGHNCTGSETTYFLEVESECNGVRLWTRMQRERDEVLPGGGDEA
jgi:hypothetical protein